MKLYLLYGGRTVEHDVTIMSTRSALSAIDYAKYEVIPVYINQTGTYIKGATLSGNVSPETALKLKLAPKAAWCEQADFSQGTKFAFEELTNRNDVVVFPMIHGTYGEDGTIQGLMEVLNIPYVGSGIRASAVGMDKIMSKMIFDEFKIPQVPYVAVLAVHYQTAAQKAAAKEAVESQLGYPVYVKPANAGSSIGVSKAESAAELADSLALAFKYDDRVVVEHALPKVRELAVGLLGNQDVQASTAGEIGKKQEFYDFESKFVDGTTKLIIPAKITSGQLAAVRKYAIIAFNSLGAAGLTRADFFLAQDGQVYLNEVQTMPGFTEFSMYPYLWQASGVSYPKLIDQLIQLGIQSYQAKQKLSFKP